MTTQLATTPLLDKLVKALSTKFPPKKVEEILHHYSILRRAARLDQYEICLINGGKFVEAILKCLNFLRTGNDADTVNVANTIRQLESDANLDSSEKTTIPRTLQAIYEFRNKRGGAHNFSFEPTKMDCVFVLAASNWVMEDLTRLYLTNDPEAAQALVKNLLVKDIPLIEEIDGDFLVLKPEISARVQLQIILYHHYPDRSLTKDLILWLHNHTAENIRTTLRNMKQKNLVHENEDGWTLTETGIREAEVEIAKMQSGGSEVKKPGSIRAKGAKHGKRRSIR